MVKNLPANAGDRGLIPGSGRSPGGGNSYPLKYSCLENPMDRGAWCISHASYTDKQDAEWLVHGHRLQSTLYKVV